MKLMKKSFSMLLAVAMVFTATFGCMTVSSFAADSEMGSETAESEKDTAGPQLVDYSIAVSNIEPKTEEGGTIKITLKFNKELKLASDASDINNDFIIRINNKTVEYMGFKFDGAKIDSKNKNNIILTITGTSEKPKLISGSLDISLKGSAYEHITDASDNKLNSWTDIHTMVPTGLTFERGEYVKGSEKDGTEESITFNVTGSAVLRGMSPIQILLSDDIDEALDNKIIDEERSTVAIHTHFYITDTNADYAKKIADNFKSNNYTITASGTAITLSANKASDTQTLKKTVIKMFGYDGPNDRYVQQTLFKNEIADADSKMNSFDKDNSDIKAAIAEAESAYKAISNSTTAIEFNKARNTLRNKLNIIYRGLYANEIEEANKRLDNINAKKVDAGRKSELETAKTEAEKNNSSVSESTSLSDLYRMRTALRNAMEGAVDVAITSTTAQRKDGYISLRFAGAGETWFNAVNKVIVDERTVTNYQKITDYGQLKISSEYFEDTRSKDYTITVKANDYDDVSKTITVKYYGAKSFQVRYLDGKGNVISKKTFTNDEMKAMSDGKDHYFNTACSMTGLRTFKAKGVSLKTLLSKAGITFGPGMTEKIRTNDSVKGNENDPENEDAYYTRGSRTYESLMQPRYYFPDLFVEGSALATEAKKTSRVTDSLRAALGASNKQEVEPFIAYEYVEKVYASNPTSLESAKYDSTYNNDMTYRFLFGTAMDSADPTMAAKEVTTWSVSYNTFGIDIVDPNYKEPSSSKPSNSSSSTVTPVTKYTVNKPADSAEGKVSVSPSSAEKGDTVTVTVTPADGYKTGNVTVTDKSGNKVSVSGSDNKYTFKMPASNVTVKVTYEKTAATQQPVQPITLPFKDVKADRWSYSAIKYAYENKLFSGTSANEFSPADEMTRGMLVTVLYRLAGEPAVNGDAGFADIKSGDWYAKAVAWAKANNIVSGVSAAEFAPNKDITREQMAAILHRYAAYKSYSTAANGSIAGFNDNANVSAFAKDAVSWAVGEKLISGTGNNTLAPKGNATREQVATILQRFAENIAK